MSGSAVAGLTVGPEEGWREEALVHQTGEGNDPDHVVCVKGQATEWLTAQLLWSDINIKTVTDERWLHELFGH